MIHAKERIPKQYRIGNTYFMSLANSGKHLFSKHPKNPNHLNKDINGLLSVIIILGTDVNDHETVFNMEWLLMTQLQ